MQKIAGMKGGADGDTVDFHPRSAETGDGGLLWAEQAFHGGGAESDNDYGGDDRDLGAKIGKACFHFVACGFSVSARFGGHIGPTFQNIRDVDLFAGEFHGGEHFGEKFSGETDEGFTLFVLIGTWSFPDEHESGFRIANTENDLRAGFGQMRADLTVDGLGSKSGEALCFCSRGWSRWGGDRAGCGFGGWGSCDAGSGKWGRARRRRFRGVGRSGGKATNEAGWEPSVLLAVTTKEFDVTGCLFAEFRVHRDTIGMPQNRAAGER